MRGASPNGEAFMPRTFLSGATKALGILAFAGAGVMVGRGLLTGADHTDGPLATGDQAADIADVYSFRSGDALVLAMTISNVQPGGFPNGRRLQDDVIDVELGLIFGVFGPAVPSLQSDGVDANDVPFQGAFPYLAAPHTP